MGRGVEGGFAQNMALVPPPWVILAFALACTTYVQDAMGILGSMLAAVLNSKEDAGCEMCSRLVALVLKVSELDETESIDCGRLCFGPRKWKHRCMDTCTRVQSAMRTSSDYPCIAAGFCPVQDTDADIVCRFNWHPRSKSFLRCTPCGLCARKFPARCVVDEGIASWMRARRLMERHASEMAHALQKRPVCGTPDAGPYCVVEPSGLGKMAELGTWFLPMIFGTLSSIRAVETPGGDDDRQVRNVLTPHHSRLSCNEQRS